MKISIIIPCFNEASTIETVVSNIRSQPLDIFEIIVVDDCSNDGSRELVLKNKDKIDNIILHDKNLGKGAAIRSAQKSIDGKFTIIQDADLEYDPNDYFLLLEHIQTNKLKILYGSRVLEHKDREKIQNFTHKFRIFANYILTKINRV